MINPFSQFFSEFFISRLRSATIEWCNGSTGDFDSPGDCSSQSSIAMGVLPFQPLLKIRGRYRETLNSDMVTHVIIATLNTISLIECLLLLLLGSRLFMVRRIRRLVVQHHAVHHAELISLQLFRVCLDSHLHVCEMMIKETQRNANVKSERISCHLRTAEFR